MCIHCGNKGHTGELPEKKYRLADFFNAHWDEYTKSPKEFIKPEQYKAVNAIRTCRTAALGVDIYACPGCGEITEIYNSCKNRFCPTCSWQDTVKWADKIKGQMLNLPHRHVVFTLPHSLNPLIKRNGKHLLNILMRTSADTLKDWISHKYGIKIGIITVLHTYGEQKDSHYHVHMIISWGGIEITIGRLKGIKGEYVNYDFLKDKFRCKFEDSLVDMFDSGELDHKFNSRKEFLWFLKRINKKNWALHLEPPMDLPPLVIRYIGRYSKRACLSEYKITQMEGGHISFRYKDYKKLNIHKKPIEKELTLHFRDFFPRLLQHVPLPYFRIVRYYGLYSNKGNIAEEYLYKELPTDDEQSNGCGNQEKEEPLYCNQCKMEKEYQHTLIEKRKTGENEQQIRIVYRRPIRNIRKVA
jgi:hypothetical protein